MLQYSIVFVHINIKPGSLLRKYQLPVIQSRRNLSIAAKRRKEKHNESKTNIPIADEDDDDAENDEFNIVQTGQDNK